MQDLSKIRNIIGEYIHKSPNMEEMLKLIYVLKAWQKMSPIIELEDPSLTFEKNYLQKIDLKQLSISFSKLAKLYKLFTLYNFQPKNFQISEIEKVISFVANNDIPTIFYKEFEEYFDRRRGTFTPSIQIAELGLKLLGRIDKKIYVPFTNGFPYIQFTDKIVFAENKSTDNDFFSEILNILDNKEIIFEETDPLKNPSFTEENAPHILKQFNSVLSFPPFGMRGKLDTNEDKFHRFKFHRGTNLDVAHFEHILSQTKSKAVILMPVGFTFRASYEGEFRKYLIDSNFIETIIQLPPNLHSATSIETTFFIINKEKQNDKVKFINLKHEKFITRSGRSLVFKNINEIIDIYNKEEKIEDIQTIVSNSDIIANNYILTIDRYVIPKEVQEQQVLLNKFQLEKLENLAEIRRSQLFKDEETGIKIYELSPSDFQNAGFTIKSKRTKQIEEQKRKLQTYKLEPYDLLVSTKGTIGKIGIVGETDNTLIASQAIQVIRLSGENMKERAIALYMFFKSNLGQSILNSLVAGTAMPQISTNEIKNLKVPDFQKSDIKQLSLNFYDEIELYNKIKDYENKISKLHENFLGENK